MLSKINLKVFFSFYIQNTKIPEKGPQPLTTENLHQIRCFEESVFGYLLDENDEIQQQLQVVVSRRNITN